MKLAVPLAPLLPRLELEAQAAAALDGAETAEQGVVRLQTAGLRTVAVRLVAHALPKREAVWWACMCARAVPHPPVATEDAEAMLAAEAWVRNPGDDSLRRAAWDAAQKTSFRTAEAWAAVGAFWSGGSISPAGQPMVPPGEHLTGVAVCGGVLLAVVKGRSDRAQSRLDRFVASARAISSGGAGRIPEEED